MSILRRDPITGRWVIIAEERAQRPHDFDPDKAGTSGSGSCPFCPGNESETPTEIVAVRPEGSARDAPDWSLRVVPNSYAALRIEGELSPTTPGLFQSMNGIGAHEVIIESPRHSGRMGDYSLTELEAILKVYKDRTEDLHRDKRFQYVQIFRNYGAAAGASLRHPHSQLIALPILPRGIEDELDLARIHFESTGRCLFCDIVAHDRAEGARLIDWNSNFATIAPFASRSPYEMWILPVEHQHDYRFIPETKLHDLAEILSRALRALDRELEGPPFNLIIHSGPEMPHFPPPRAQVAEFYHWHIEIIPRLTSLAGFEWGTGFHINPVAPEQAAARLRRALET